MKKAISIIIVVALLFSFAIAEFPDYTGTPAIAVNDNIPNFTEDELTWFTGIFYSDLDELGRVGMAMACIGPVLPDGERAYTFTIEPTGWNNHQYEFVSGNYLYQRSHMIAHRFSGGGEIQKNLFTGTQYLNQKLMADIETIVANYVKQTGNHVLYRVTPDFRGDELVCRGVEIEAQSVEDQSVKFHVYLYNFQPGVAIDYMTGESRVAEYRSEPITRTSPDTPEPTETPNPVRVYVLNTNTMRFHLPSCHSVYEMQPKNRKDYTGTREELIGQGYKPCGECKP